MSTKDSTKSKVVLGGYDPANMLPYPTASSPNFYWYDNVHDDKEWGIEVRDIQIDGVSLDSGILTYASVDPFDPFVQLPDAYYKNYKAYMAANHTEMVCMDAVIGFGICMAQGITCESIMGNYTNITIRLNDSYGYVLPPSSYLKTEITESGNTLCYSMVIGNSLFTDKITLGDVFMENYHAILDFGNTSIGLNGFVIEDLPVVPTKRSSGLTTTIIVVAGAGILLLAIVSGVCHIMKKRRDNLKLSLEHYNQIENESEVY